MDDEVQAGAVGLEGDEEGSRIVGEELRLLAVVRRAFESATRRKRRDPVNTEDRRLLELREDISEAREEDLPALLGQMHQAGALRAQRTQQAEGYVDPNSPYFGHLRLEEDGRRRDILIGNSTYIDPGSSVRIIDWRNAPISQVYYRYSEGDDYDEWVGDRATEGMVLAKRSVSIIQGRLYRVSCQQGTFVRDRQGGPWKRLAASRTRLRTERRERPASARLGVGADGRAREDRHLPAIASLLDAEQFERISRQSHGLLTVQGSAGSGKTTVGLHRVAYLTFTEPDRFQPDRMLVIMPNEALVTYVGQVLPTLGVRGVPVSTFTQWAAGRVRELFPKLPTALQPETPSVVSRAKTSRAMLLGLEAAIRRLEEELGEELEKKLSRFRERTRVGEAWRALVREPRLPLSAKVSRLAEWAAGREAIPGVGAASLPTAARVTFENRIGELRQRARAVVPLVQEFLCDRAALSEAFSGVESFSATQLDHVHEWCRRQRRILEEGGGEGEEATLDAEDLALLLRAWQRMVRPLTNERNEPLAYAHLFIDEVQDMSPVELRVLLDLAGEDPCITLAGDAAQRLSEEGQERSEFRWEQMLHELGFPHERLEPLKVSYRSTAEITTFAQRVLGPYAHAEEPVTTRSGPPVELFTFVSVGEAVAFLAEALRQLAVDEPQASVALISRFPEQASVYSGGLRRAEVPLVRHVQNYDFTWRPGVEVTHVRQTKGLEFDEVVLLDTTVVSYPDSAPARHALYTAATRAAHQLWCVASQEPSLLVKQALEEAEGGSRQEELG